MGAALLLWRRRAGVQAFSDRRGRRDRAAGRGGVRIGLERSRPEGGNAFGPAYAGGDQGKLELKEPKSAKGRRLVELPQVAINALHEHRKRMLAEGHLDSPVFCNSEGGWLRRSNFIRNTYKPLLKRAGLPHLKFHGLRHSSATLLLAQGVHPKIVQERLGHSQISLTLDTYSHVLPSMQKEAAAKLNRLLDGTGP